MEVLFRLVASVLGESSVVHEQIRLFCQCFHLLRRTSVDSIDNLQAWAWFLDNLARRDCFPFDFDLVAYLKLFPQSSFRDAYPFRFFKANPAAALCLDNTIGETGTVVHCLACLAAVTVIRYFLPGLALSV